MEIIPDESMAPHVLPRAHISPRMLKRVIEVIQEFYPDEWLQELKTRYESAGHLMFKHPLYTGLLQAVSIDTVTVAEMAACLNSLRGKTNLGKIVEEMKKDESFDDYFYQLSISHRLSYLDPDVALEPLIAGKTPDNAFTFWDVKCIAECTIIKEHTVYTRFHECIEYLAQVVFREMRRNNVKKTIKIEVNHESIIRKRDEVEAAIVGLIAGGQNTSVELDCCTLKMSELNDIPPYDIRWSEDIVPSEEYHEVLQNPRQRNPDHAMGNFVISYSKIADGIQKDFVDKLDAKIQSKREQVKVLKQQGYEIFLFVDTDISWDKMEKDGVGKVMRESLLGSTMGSDLFSMITLTNKPRGSLDPFALNQMTINRTHLSEEGWNDFWRKFMEPSVLHAFPQQAERNDLCPCGIGIKNKHCHGSFPTE